MKPRSVFDTNTIVSALIFPTGRLRWLLGHWRGKECTPLVCAETAAELSRVLAYPKFQLESEERIELLAEYLPFCEIVELVQLCPQTCRDPKDQIFLDLAHSGRAEVLITGDRDLLEMDSQTAFAIQTPEAYRAQVERNRS